MKKKISIILAFLIAVSVSVAGAISGADVNVNASSAKIQSISDDFNAKSLDTEIWESTGNAGVIHNNMLVNYSAMAVIAEENGKPSQIPVSMKNDGTVYALKFVCDVAEDKADNKADLYLCEYDPEAEVQSYGEKKGTLTGLSLKGYFGFGSMSSGGTANIGHIKVTDASGNLIWEPANDLENDDIDMIYGAQAADATKEFRLWNSYKDEKKDKYRTGVVAEAQLGANSSLTTKHTVV